MYFFLSYVCVCMWGKIYSFGKMVIETSRNCLHIFFFFHGFFSSLFTRKFQITSFSFLLLLRFTQKRHSFPLTKIKRKKWQRMKKGYQRLFLFFSIKIISFNAPLLSAMCLKNEHILCRKYIYKHKIDWNLCIVGWGLNGLRKLLLIHFGFEIIFDFNEK